MSPETIKELAYEYFGQFGLVGWKFGINDRKRSIGMCFYRTKIIEISMDLVRSKNVTEIKGTILHEIAHALVGPGNGHNHVWRARAIEVGAKPVACVQLGSVPESGVGAKFKADCNCGKPHFRYRRSKRMDQFQCAYTRKPLIYRPI